MSQTCSNCGAQESDTSELLTWATSIEQGRTLHYCRTCSRENVRALEGKLDHEWW